MEIPIETTQVSEPQGTRLTINGDDQLRAEWDSERFEQLQFELKKLKSPVSTVFSDDEFRIHLTVNGFPQVEDIEEVVEPYLLFDLFDYKISGRIGANGKGTLTYTSQKARNIAEEQIAFDIRDELSFDFESSTGCGQFDIDIRVYDRDSDALASLIRRGLKDESGNYVGKNQVRQLLNTYNGIGVYRNGFRIRPLGDPDFDWLQLNKRRVQNPSLCIRNDQTIGYVQIESDYWSGLIEKSARDGFKENEAFNQLKEVTTAVIRQLETRRFNYRKSAGLSRPAVKVERELKRLFDFDELKKRVRTQLTKAELDETTVDEIIALINQEEENKNKSSEEIRQEVAIYQTQATLGKLLSLIIHESRNLLSYFRHRIPHIRRWNEAFQKTRDPGQLDKLLSIADGIEEEYGGPCDTLPQTQSFDSGKITHKETTRTEKNDRDRIFHL